MPRYRQLSLALFDESIKDDFAYLALCKIELAADGKLPEWIPLVPKGDASGLVEALDGRNFYNKKPQDVVDAFNADPRDLPLDWEHSTEIRSPDGLPSPAAAWIDKMEVRNGGEIWGHVREWTPKGAESVKTKEYRYISPAFLFEKATKLITDIISAGLVNRPALNMPAIARSKSQKRSQAQARAEDTMDRKELIKKLGLAEDATDEQILAALDELKAGPQAKIEELTAELETARTKLKDTETELANARDANPALDEFVPRADYDAAIARAKTAEDKIKSNEQDAHQKTVDAEIDAALKAGKIVPATKDFYVATCSTKEGLEQFRSFVKTAPTVADPSKLETDPPPITSDDTKVSREEEEIMKTMGMTREEYLKERAEMRAQTQGS